MRKIIVAAAMACAMATCMSAYAADPNTWWVDDNSYGAAVQDGSEEHPFGTILAAITNTACAAGDTIKVRPGVYDKDFYEREYSATVSGVTTHYRSRARIDISKKVNIIATGTKEETHIVGRFATEAEGWDSDFHCCGDTAVRCITVTGDGRGSTLTGFTLRDGATIDYRKSTVYSCGGAIGVASHNTQFYVTDCVISNCVGRYGGGAGYGGTFNRCFIYGCQTYLRGAALYDGYAINSVFTGCSTKSDSYSTISCGLGDDCKLVNCTIYGNSSAKVDTENCFNCLFAGNGSVEKTNELVNATNIYASPGRGYCNESNEFPLFAPYEGDYHPLASSVAIGAGDPSKFSIITLPAGIEIRDMDGNLIDLAAEHINAGAYQTAKVVPEHNYGAVLFNGAVGINGFVPSLAPRTLVHADSWPTTIKAYPGDNNFRLAVSGAKSTDLLSRFAGKDGYVAITPPYERGAVQTNTIESLTEIGTRYVDAVNGSDDNDGLTKDTAYQTLQKVIENGADTKNRRVIYVAEGDYNTGGGYDSNSRGVTNRINLTKRLWLKFIATGDRDKTIIRGAAAKNEPDPVKYPGCGPDAVRCVNFYYGNGSSTDEQTIAFVGFTFADGHSDVSSSPYGGAAYGRLKGTDHLQFVDCVFTNCYAPEGGISTRAHFTRCRFIDCGGGTHAFRYSILNSCVVEKGNYGTGVFGPSVTAVNCSVADSNAIEPGNSNQTILNCALGESGSMSSSGVTWGSTANSCFADAANGDFRLVSGSPALDATRRTFPAQDTADWTSFTKYFSDFASDNIDGTPWLFSGGFPVAGASGGWVPGVSLILDANDYVITGGSVGGNPLSPGDTMTISRSTSAVRHYGIVENGVTNNLDSGAYVYTMPESVGMGNVIIGALIDQNWYVNPDSESGASDLNDGFTANTPKLTLAGVLSVATNAGDIVYAYPGTYDSGEMRHAKGVPDASRGVVAANVTLQAVGSVSETIIKGASSTHEHADANGNGTNAVRCVYVRDGGCVRGFKLTDGRTNRGEDKQPCFGGGAYLNGGALVDCDVTENSSGSYGAGVAGVNDAAVIRCKVYENGPTSYLVHGATLIDSYVDGSCLQCPCVLNSTVTKQARASEKTPGIVVNTHLESAARWACCTNCAFTGSVENAIKTGANDKVSYDPDNCHFRITRDANLDGDYRPVSPASVLVDAGSKALYDEWFPSKWAKFKGRDRLGGQRIYNGEIDIGCGEYDFRGDFAALLGERAVISEMGPNVTTNAVPNIVVPEGDSITVAMSPRGAGRETRYELVYTPEGGSRTVYSEASAEAFSHTLEGACTVEALSGYVGFTFLLR